MQMRERILNCEISDLDFWNVGSLIFSLVKHRGGFRYRLHVFRGLGCCRHAKFAIRPLVFCIVMVLVTSNAGAVWKIARPDYSWSFPQDHWARDGFKTEWWYFTGHLRSVDAPMRRFGYQFTFFRVGVLPNKPALASEWATKDVVMGHAALTDLDSGQHRFSELAVRAVPFLGGFGRYPDPLLVWSVGPTGTPEHWQLRWNGAGFDFSMTDVAKAVGFDLSTHPTKPLIFQGPGGVSRKGESAGEASHYYSYTRLATRGTVSVGGQKIAVTGVSWMDKEFGSNQLGEDKKGWDWFSLQLEDGREIMLYLLRSRTGETVYTGGTVVGATGQVRYLGPDDWQLTATGEWTSRETGAAYPAGWMLRLFNTNIDVVVKPKVQDQENRSTLIPNLYYWEGSVSVESVTGELIGAGYVELTGYGEKSRPPI